MIWLLFLLSGLTGTWDKVETRFKKKNGIEDCKRQTLIVKKGKQIHKVVYTDTALKVIASGYAQLITMIGLMGGETIETEKNILKELKKIARKGHEVVYKWEAIGDRLYLESEEVNAVYTYWIEGDTLFLTNERVEFKDAGPLAQRLLQFWYHDMVDALNQSPEDVWVYVRRRGLRKLFRRR